MGLQLLIRFNTYIEPDVVIESDVVIYPGSMILGKSIIRK